MFSIWRAKDGENKVEDFDRSRKPICSRVMEYKELALSIRHLDAGRYFIVPSTKDPNRYGKYYLNIYASEDLSTENCKYVTSYVEKGEPKKYEFGEVIKEEEEDDKATREFVDKNPEIVKILKIK